MDTFLRFEHPQILWLVPVVICLLAWFFRWSRRKHQKLINVFVKSRLLAALTVGVSHQRQLVRMGLLTIAVGLLLVALSRPQYGFHWEEVRQKGLDIVVAIDTSKSMLAADIAPNRLERSRLAAFDLMALARRDRLGLVAFAGTAFLQCPLTLDDEAFRQSLNALSTEIIPQGGTALKEALETAKKAFDASNDNYRAIIIISDGEDHEEGMVEAAEIAAAQGYRVFTVGVGTTSGELLKITDDNGQITYLKDNQGNVVKSSLNEALLRQVATAGQGSYIHLRDTKSLEMLYESGLEPLPKGELSSRLTRQYHERFQWPLALAILCLLAELFVVDQRQVKRPDGPIRSATVLREHVN
ncbi:MAG: hypothetical protein M2R45_00288 [Verrucomicrobia subdivision 3 bacterium]|nr:hypothetical protein [Limisphaerales bacterium]MCS1412952.1 hypothetical protein [Limisphaerales bacterium]